MFNQNDLNKLGRLNAIGVIALSFCLTVFANEDSPTEKLTPAGLWEAFDDNGAPTGFIRIVEQDGVYTGVIEKGLPTDKEDKRCTACKDERKDKKLLGMTIMKGVKAAGNVYEGSEILDPFSGNTYRVKLTIKDVKKMEVRGFIGVSLFGRTQLWERVEHE